MFRFIAAALASFVLSLGFTFSAAPASANSDEPWYDGPANLEFRIVENGTPTGWYRDQFWDNPLPAEFIVRYGEVGIATAPPQLINGRWEQFPLVDARWVRVGHVSPGKDYTLSGYVWTENVYSDQRAVPSGASLRVMDGIPGVGNPGLTDESGTHWWVMTDPINGSQGWTHVSVRFNTGPLTEIHFGPSLGAYAGTAGGKMWARDLRLERS